MFPKHATCAHGLFIPQAWQHNPRSASPPPSQLSALKQPVVAAPAGLQHQQPWQVTRWCGGVWPGWSRRPAELHQVPCSAPGTTGWSASITLQDQPGWASRLWFEPDRVSQTCNPNTFCVCFCHHHHNNSDRGEETQGGGQDYWGLKKLHLFIHWWDVKQPLGQRFSTFFSTSEKLRIKCTICYFWGEGRSQTLWRNKHPESRTVSRQEESPESPF